MQVPHPLNTEISEEGNICRFAKAFGRDILWVGNAVRIHGDRSVSFPGGGPVQSRVFLTQYAPGGPDKKTRFTKNQIIAILKEGEAGVQVKEICRKHKISDALYYKRKSKCGGMSDSDLKRMCADMVLENSGSGIYATGFAGGFWLACENKRDAQVGLEAG